MSDGAPRLDDRAVLAAVDPHGARDVLAAVPAQCRAATTIEPRRLPALKRPRVVIIAGMGGSAAAGDLIAGCAAVRLDVPIVVHRGYGLPSVAWDDALVIAVSYSGETVEVVSAVETARARDLPVIVVTSGGRLGALARRHGLASAEVPPGLMPRMALGYLFFPIAHALRALDLEVVGAADVDEALTIIESLGIDLGTAQPSPVNEAKRIALAIDGRWPAVYGGPVTGAVAYRWKTDFEENAKTFALAGALPEVHHNTIEAWRAPSASRLALVLLRDGQEDAPIRRRFELLEELARGVAGGVTSCWTRGASPLARLLSMTYLGQWVSYYLAILYGVDPWSVPQLDEVKRRLHDH